MNEISSTASSTASYCKQVVNVRSPQSSLQTLEHRPSLDDEDLTLTSSGSTSSLNSSSSTTTLQQHRRVRQTVMLEPPKKPYEFNQNVDNQNSLLSSTKTCPTSGSVTMRSQCSVASSKSDVEKTIKSELLKRMELVKSFNGFLGERRKSSELSSPIRRSVALTKNDVDSIIKQCETIDECQKLLDLAWDKSNRAPLTSTSLLGPDMRNGVIASTMFDLLEHFTEAADTDMGLHGLENMAVDPADILIVPKLTEKMADTPPAFSNNGYSSEHCGNINNSDSEQCKTAMLRLQLTSAKLIRNFVTKIDLDEELEGLSHSQQPVTATSTAALNGTFSSHPQQGLVKSVVNCSQLFKKEQPIYREFIAILEELAKRMERACQSIIQFGGVDSLLFACQSTDIETLRLSALTFAYLALKGDENNLAELVQRNVHEWLFPLAFHEDDVLVYYAFVALILLLRYKGMVPVVMNSNLVGLFIPFIDTHDPTHFITNKQVNVAVFSPEWLKCILPAFCIRHDGVRALVLFHIVCSINIRPDCLEQFATELEKNALVEGLSALAGLHNPPNSNLARQALTLLSRPVPSCLTRQVSLWSEKEVACWMSRIGFGHLANKVTELSLNGELLLTLLESEVRDDLGVTSGLMRRRLLRQIACLKTQADYCNEDHQKLAEILVNASVPQSTEISPVKSTAVSLFPPLNTSLRQYTYNLLHAGVDCSVLSRLTDQMLHEACGISNPIHRMQILNALTCPSLTSGQNQAIEAFVSYRRENGCHLASLLVVSLKIRKFRVFQDVRDLSAGRFDEGLMASIKASQNFLLILTPGALNRCINDVDGTDWVHKEIKCALDNDCNIIPVMYNFEWPSLELLPDDIRRLPTYNGVKWVPEYVDACVDEVVRFMEKTKEKRPARQSRS